MAGQSNQPRNPDGSLKPLEGQAEFDKLRELVDAEKYTEAETGFKELAKKYKDKPIEEDAMFYVAECQFLQKHYPAAQDSIDELLNKYTGSRYIEKSTRRLFAIANTWLNSPKPASEVELAAYQKGELKKDLPTPPETEAPAPRLAPNFFDDSRPIFDTPGRALQALKSIWLKDPTGPLADDALMMTATYHLRNKDFREADHYFGTLRESYPKSEHIQLAYVLGSHAKMMTYQGALYDGRQLEEARKLVQATIKLFPKTPQRKQLDKDLAAMKLMMAERDWQMAQLYVRKGQPKAAAMYCHALMDEYSETEFEGKARHLLAEIDPKGTLVIPAGGTMPIQRRPQTIMASHEKEAAKEKEADPSCAAPRNSNQKPTRTASAAGAGRVRLGGTRTASRDSDEFTPGATGGPRNKAVAIPDELPELEEVPAPPRKLPASAGSLKEPRKMEPDPEEELHDLPERLVPVQREARSSLTPPRKRIPKSDPDESP